MDDWEYSPRYYPHFDPPIEKERAKAIASDAKAVAQHSFWPFLSFVKMIPRYRSAKGKVELKERKLCYAAHSDRAIYSYYAHLISKRFEETLGPEEPAVLAYRSLGKSNVDFARNVFDAIRKRGPCTALAFDISGFFDHLAHGRLKTAWTKLFDVGRLPHDHYAVFRSLTRFASVDRAAVFNELGVDDANHVGRLCTPNEFRDIVRPAKLIETNPDPFGIPQGSSASAVLSNVYMRPFDIAVQDFAAEYGALYRRYSDDILIVCEHEEVAEAKALVHHQLRELDLELHEDKTDEVRFTKTADGLTSESIDADGSANAASLQYLGLEFDGREVSIRSSTIARFYGRMARGVRAKKLAAAKNPADQQLYRYGLYEAYSHLGKQNFIRYAYRAHDTVGETSRIRGQVAGHWRLLHDRIDDD